MAKQIAAVIIFILFFGINAALYLTGASIEENSIFLIIDEIGAIAVIVFLLCAFV